MGITSSSRFTKNYRQRKYGLNKRSSTRYAFSNPEYRKWIATYSMNNYMKTELDFANSNSEKLRCAVAYNTNDKEVMLRLSVDRSVVVRKIIAKRCSNEILNLMVSDTDISVRCIIAKRTTNMVTLIRLLGDKNAAVVCSSIRNAGYLPIYRQYVNDSYNEVVALLAFGI